MMKATLKIAPAVLALAVICAPLTAAGHGRPGLWRIVITMEGGSDMSRMPPEAQARMKAMGMGAGGGAVTVQRCRTPQEAAQDTPPAGADKSCVVSNAKFAGGVMTADLTCTGNFVGTGHVRFVWDSDTHYAGEVSMSGTTRGHQVSHSQKIDGTWLSAQCPDAPK